MAIRFNPKTVREVTIYAGMYLDFNPYCIETGCMYVCPPGNEVHTTTNNIVDNICRPLDGWLISFDIDEEHIRFAGEFVSSDGIFTVFEQGDSVVKIKSHFENIHHSCVDFACFDSKDFDPNHMVLEFEAVKPYLKKNHFILVDDIHNPNSVKADKMVPLLKSLGYEWREVSTPTGMFVASKGYPLW